MVVALDVNRTANAMGFGNAGTIQCPEIATPVMKPGGIALFFSLSLTLGQG